MKDKEAREKLDRIQEDLRLIADRLSALELQCNGRNGCQSVFGWVTPVYGTRETVFAIVEHLNLAISRVPASESKIILRKKKRRPDL